MFLQFSHNVPSFTISHFSESSFLVNCKTEFVKAFQEVSSKSKCSVYLECSRLEEYVGNVDGSEWKVYLQLILLETHTGSIARGATRSSAAAQSVGSQKVQLMEA